MIKGIIVLIAVGIIVVILLTFLRGLKVGPRPTTPSQTPIQTSRVDYSKEYPAEAAGVSGFEQKNTGIYFTAFYHPGDEANANKSLALLEQAGVPLYQKYLGLTPKDIPVYLTTSVDEYVRVALFPGGKENVRIGDGSAPMGKIYLYKPFDDKTPGKVEGMIIHEGTHAVIFQLLGQDKMQALPGFLNEGLAHYVEFVFKAGGAKFNPLDQIYHADLLVSGIKTGNPKLLSLDDLGKKCEGFISEEALNFLCRGQGTYTVWYIAQNYGEDAWGKFLIGLKQTQNWQTSLQNLTGKTMSKLGQEIEDQLKSVAQQRH